MTSDAPTPDEAAALLRVAEQQLDQWKAECRALEARLRAQQPVIDAAEEYVEIGGKWSHNELVRGVDAYRAASGSVEADTPAEPDEDTLGSLTGHCCPMMRDQSTLDCEQHHDHPIDCPDVLVLHGPQGPGLPIRDGGSSWVAIRYCPWCATDLCAREVASAPAEPDGVTVESAARQFARLLPGDDVVVDVAPDGRSARAYLREVAGTPVEPDLLGRLQSSIERAREARREAGATGSPEPAAQGFKEAAEDLNRETGAAAGPSASSPWTVTLAWAPGQNYGRVSVLSGRAPVRAILGLVEAGESVDAVAAEFGVTVEAVQVLRELAADLRDDTPAAEPAPDREQAPHFMHTQDVIEDALVGAGYQDLPDLTDIVFVATEAARDALGVCQVCGSGQPGMYPSDPSADGYAGPEECSACDGTGWARAGAGAPTEPAEVPTCGVVYTGRFWHGAPCRHGRGHEGRHADVYGRTWTNDADEDAAPTEPADDTQETTP